MGWVAPIKNEESLERFKEALKKVDIKYYIMFEIGIGSGLLLQDILKLRVKDVYQKKELVVHIGVRQTERIYFIPEDVQKVINNFCEGKSPETFLIPGHSTSNAPVSREQAYRVFKSVGKSVGLGTIGAQTMRKTFAWRYYKEHDDITYLQNLFNHASPTITYRYIGEKPNVQVVLKKYSSEENERSRYMLYLDNSGKKRIDAAIDELTKIKEKFDDPSNNDAFYGCVDCLLQELDSLLESYRESSKSPYDFDK